MARIPYLGRIADQADRWCIIPDGPCRSNWRRHGVDYGRLNFMSRNDDHVPTASDDAQRRIVALEERLMFQQRLLEELSGVALDHRRELDKLASELAQCRAALQRLSDAREAGDLPHEKPPHY
jgi:uncharacterized coiled-coil protein SlyX